MHANKDEAANPRRNSISYPFSPCALGQKLLLVLCVHVYMGVDVALRHALSMRLDDKLYLGSIPMARQREKKRLQKANRRVKHVCRAQPRRPHSGNAQPWMDVEQAL